MKPSVLTLVALVSLTLGAVQVSQANTGGVKSLRGDTELSSQDAADALKGPVDQDKPYASDYVFQPPLIPHKIRHYEMSLNANKCLACHSWKNARDSGATKISVTHYQARDGEVLADVSPRRYFCLQCHVPQVDAEPIVNNTFERVESLRQ
ncbi:nitrate reductase cytochrome c-type subunit [Paraferrimonas sedimenticola]|uniref:Periplasmic nitrate reductase, electron transfer subunit n=1 Tax=Paraferrimonas sedimenticola TaxID=375674 RepID=A0AA37RV04_9GAMM|nr:nitrate reductase cytochrome c-type subunit [Paraferrimonas sedimenticola]GLP95708.1 periplasmic nitrate reductase cytochrome c-type protein [Paraferrimonas sedimenticola]